MGKSLGHGFAILAAIYRSAQEHRPESASESAFGVSLGTWLGVPQRVLQGVLLKQQENEGTKRPADKRPEKGPQKAQAPKSGKYRRKTKGQQLKGKIVWALFHTLWHFSTHFHTFSEFFRIFPPRFFLRIRGFYCCFSSKRQKIKEHKRE